MGDIFEEIVRIRSEGGSAALATVIKANGSTPRGEGSKMLIRADGAILGSIGGGSLEAKVCREAMDVMREARPKVLHFNLTGEEVAEEGMLCGGNMDIFVEPIVAQPTVYIFGAGHVSFSISKIAKMVGFKVAVVDNRTEFANTNRFPEADEILIEDLSGIFSKLKINRLSYIVIVTRGHQFDEQILEWAVKTEADYIGMIGSRKKKEAVFSHLQCKGVSKKLLEGVHAPIGIDINAETPEEIAVSIMAEIIKVRRERGHRAKTREL
ncbi:MAG: XdhC family protein [Desulfatiglandales bacterium]